MNEQLKVLLSYLNTRLPLHFFTVSLILRLRNFLSLGQSRACVSVVGGKIASTAALMHTRRSQTQGLSVGKGKSKPLLQHRFQISLRMLVSGWTEKKNPMCLVPNHTLLVFSNTVSNRYRIPTQMLVSSSHLSCLFSMSYTKRKVFVYISTPKPLIGKALLDARHAWRAVLSADLSGPLRPKKCITFGYGRKRCM